MAPDAASRRLLGKVGHLIHKINVPALPLQTHSAPSAGRSPSLGDLDRRPRQELHLHGSIWRNGRAGESATVYMMSTGQSRHRGSYKTTEGDEDPSTADRDPRIDIVVLAENLKGVPNHNHRAERTSFVIQSELDTCVLYCRVCCHSLYIVGLFIESNRPNDYVNATNIYM